MQADVLASLRTFGEWRRATPAFVCVSRAYTERVLDTLVRRGLVLRDGLGRRAVYTPIDG